MSARRKWRPPVAPISYEEGISDRVSVRLSADARRIPPQRIYGPVEVTAPVWPAELDACSFSRPKQQYQNEEDMFAVANGWRALRASDPPSLGALPFSRALELLTCPTAFVREDGACVALVVYGSLIARGLPSELGDVVIDLLPMPEPAFLIRLAPPAEKTAV